MGRWMGKTGLYGLVQFRMYTPSLHHPVFGPAVRRYAGKLTNLGSTPLWLSISSKFVVY